MQGVESDKKFVDVDLSLKRRIHVSTQGEMFEIAVRARPHISFPMRVAHCNKCSEQNWLRSRVRRSDGRLHIREFFPPPNQVEVEGVGKIPFCVRFAHLANQAAPKGTVR
jgi:hypothetical protein